MPSTLKKPTHQREKRQLLMLLTTEPVTNAVQAATIALVYCWHVEYHKVLKSAAKLKVIG